MVPAARLYADRLAPLVDDSNAGTLWHDLADDGYGRAALAADLLQRVRRCRRQELVVFAAAEGQRRPLARVCCPAGEPSAGRRSTLTTAPTPLARHSLPRSSSSPSLTSMAA